MALASFSGFARILGEGDEYYVAALAHAGRLVLGEGGKAVDVEASLAKLRASTEPPIAPFTTASFRQFARILGDRSPSYVTQLKDAGRLVLTSDGKRVLTKESLDRIAATADPSRAGVVARHAAARTAAAPAPPPAQGEGGEGEEAEGEGAGYQHWRARSERAKALAAERDNRLRDRELLEASEVTATVAAAVTALRTRLESLADVLGPQLAAIDDEAQCRAVVAETVEHALEEASRQFQALGRVEGGPT